ncbi:hypothetical protein GGF31_003684 [Allomyces arbusculus]|nr:hypothetical protein GGF31_003684 [Allomyces arbusculus]
MANFLNTRWLRDDVLAAAREGRFALHLDATVILGVHDHNHQHHGHALPTDPAIHAAAAAARPKRPVRKLQLIDFDRYPSDVANLHSATFTASDGAHTIHARLTESAAASLVQGESQFALVDLQNLLITVTDYDLIWSHAPQLDTTRNDLWIRIHHVAEAHILHHTVGTPVALLAIGLVKNALTELYTTRIQPAIDARRPATPVPDVSMADLSPPTPPASDAADFDDDPTPASTLTPRGPWPPPVPLLSDDACQVPLEQQQLLERILWPPPSLSSGKSGPSTAPTPSAAVTGTPPSPVSSTTEDDDNLGHLSTSLPPATPAPMAPAPATPALPPPTPRPTSPSPCLAPLCDSLDRLGPPLQSAALPAASSVTLSLTARSVVSDSGNSHAGTPPRALSVPAHAQADISPALTLPSLGLTPVSPPLQLPHAPALFAVPQETGQPSGTPTSSSPSSTQSHVPQPDTPARHDEPDPAIVLSPPTPPVATFVEPAPDTQVLVRGVWFADSPDWSSLDAGIGAVDTQADDVHFDLFTQPYRDYHASRRGSEEPLSDQISFGDETDGSSDDDERLMDTVEPSGATVPSPADSPVESDVHADAHLPAGRADVPDSAPLSVDEHDSPPRLDLAATSQGAWALTQPFLILDSQASLDLEVLFGNAPAPPPRPASDANPGEVVAATNGTVDESLMIAASNGARDPAPASVPDVPEPRRVPQETAADVDDAARGDLAHAPMERIVSPSPMMADPLMPEILPGRGTAADPTPDSHLSSMILDASVASQDPPHYDCDSSPVMDPVFDVDPAPGPSVDTAGPPSSSRTLARARSDDDADESAMTAPPTPPRLPSPPILTLMPSNDDDADENNVPLNAPLPPPPALPPPPVIALGPSPFFPNPIPPSQSSRSSSVDDELDELAEHGGERAVLSLELLSSPVLSPALPPSSPPCVSPVPAPPPLSPSVPPLPCTPPLLPSFTPRPPPPKRHAVLILPRVPRSVLARCRIGATSAATAANAQLYVPPPDRSEQPPPLVVYLPPPRTAVPPATPPMPEEVETDVKEQGSSSPDVIRPRKRRRRFFLSQEPEDGDGDDA